MGVRVATFNSLAFIWTELSSVDAIYYVYQHNGYQGNNEWLGYVRAWVSHLCTGFERARASAYQAHSSNSIYDRCLSAQPIHWIIQYQAKVVSNWPNVEVHITNFDDIFSFIPNISEIISSEWGFMCRYSLASISLGVILNTVVILFHTTPTQLLWQREINELTF